MDIFWNCTMQGVIQRRINISSRGSCDPSCCLRMYWENVRRWSVMLPSTEEVLLVGGSRKGYPY